jgi:hypothetical protein
MPAFAGMTALPVALLLRGENPVAAGLQSDKIAGPKLPIPWCVDFDHGLVRGQGDFGALLPGGPICMS